MSHTTEHLGPLPLNWRDVGLSLMKTRVTGDQSNASRPFSRPHERRVRDGRSIAPTSANVASLTSGGDKTIEESYGKISIPAGRLLRSGQLCPHHESATIGHPRTIINLRRSDDASCSYHPSLIVCRDTDARVSDTKNGLFDKIPRVSLHHMAADNSLEKYDTSTPDVARWIASVLRLMEKAEPPIMVHCRSGKDRTGVVIAAALLAVGVDSEDVRREYLISPGTDEKHIDMALRGLLQQVGDDKTKSAQRPSRKHIASNKPPLWLRGVNKSLLKRNLLGDHILTQVEVDNSEPNISSCAVGLASVLSHVHNPKIQNEFEYLRKRMHVLQSVASATFGTQGFTFEKIDLGTQGLINAIIDVLSRQIYMLKNWQSVFYDENNLLYNTNSSNSFADTRKEEAASALSKRIAVAWGKMGYFNAMIGEYVTARDCFERALEESMLVIPDDGGILSSKQNEWRKQMKRWSDAAATI